MSIRTTPLGKCPCGGEIFATDNPVGVMHTMPYCQAFNTLEPDEYLTYVRRKRGITDEEAIRITSLHSGDGKRGTDE